MVRSGTILLLCLSVLLSVSLSVPGLCQEAGKSAVLFDSFNGGGVTEGPSKATAFKVTATTTITSISTYHWNGGRGAEPGTVSIKDSGGRSFGSFQCSSDNGQGGARNAFWICNPDVTLPPGDYVILDSDPGTWSTNSQSKGVGFCRIEGTQAAPSTTPAADPTTVETTEIRKSKTDQTIGYRNKLEVVVPSSVIGKGTKITIAEIPEEKLIEGEEGLIPVPIGGFDIKLGDDKEFKEPVELRIKYDPKELNPKYTAQEQLGVETWNSKLQEWVPVPGTVDEKNSVICVRTTHLSGWKGKIFGVGLRGVASAGFYTAGAAAVTYLGHMAYEKVAMDIHSTSIFKILYQESDVSSSSVRDTKWWLNRPDKSGYKAGVSHYVQDLASFLDSAFNSYRAAGFDPPYVPIEVKVNSALIKAMGNPGGFEKAHRRLHFDTEKTRDTNALKHVSAHELFHRIQYMDVNAEAWWADATAEYASCRIAWNLDEMGGGPGAVDPKLLKYPLPATGSPDAGFTDIEYDKGCYVESLVRSGANFHDLWKYVADNYGGYDPILDPLDDYLKTKGNPMHRWYRDYASWFLFSNDSPVRALDPEKHCADDKKSLPRPVAKGAAMKPIDLPFDVAENYSSCVWALRAPAEKGKTSRKVVFETVELNPGVDVDVYILKGNARIAGRLKADAKFSEVGQSAMVDVGDKDVVYLVATNALTEAEEVVVRVSDGTLSFALQPAKIVEKQGNLKHDFTAIATSIPPTVKNASVEWTFGGKPGTTPTPEKIGPNSKMESKYTYDFPSGGHYEVVAALYDATAGKKTLLGKATGTVDITAPPTLALTPQHQSAKPKAKVAFSAAVQNGPKKPVFKWNFGDGSVGSKTSLPSSSHSYTTAKTYQVQVSMLDAANPKVTLAQASGTINIAAAPKAPKPVAKTPVKPTSKAKPTVTAAKKPRWLFVSPKVYQSQDYNVADYSRQSGSASEGSIKSEEICTLGETTSTTTCQMSWQYTSKIDQLLPGAKLKVSAAFSGTGSGNLTGWVAFQDPGTPWNFFDTSLPCLADLFLPGHPKQTNEVTVPSGRKVGDRMLLRAHANAGRSGMTYDRIYEWKAE